MKFCIIAIASINELIGHLVVALNEKIYLYGKFDYFEFKVLLN
jgi:hypothetical protein